MQEPFIYAAGLRGANDKSAKLSRLSFEVTVAAAAAAAVPLCG